MALLKATHIVRIINEIILRTSEGALKWEGSDADPSKYGYQSGQYPAKDYIRTVYRTSAQGVRLEVFGIASRLEKGDQVSPGKLLLVCDRGLISCDSMSQSLSDYTSDPLQSLWKLLTGASEVAEPALSYEDLEKVLKELPKPEADTELSGMPSLWQPKCMPDANEELINSVYQKSAELWDNHL